MMKTVDLMDLIGKPFHADGYGPDNYSCYGLAVEVFKRFGFDIPRLNISVCACKETSQKEIQDQISNNWEKIEMLEVPAALVILSAHPDYANHIGVYIGNDRFIHATMGRNVECARLSNWKKRIIGHYRYVS